MFKTAAAVIALGLLSSTSVWAADPPDAPAPPPAPTEAGSVSVSVPGGAPGTNPQFDVKQAKMRMEYDAAAVQADAINAQLDQLISMDAAAETQYGPESAKVLNLRQQIKLLQERLQQLSPKAEGFPNFPANVTFLGVGAEPVSEAMGEQLQLQPGFGLMVQSISPGSPAEAAGIKRYDVLTKLDDQLLIAPAQLEALVRSHKNGDQVTITLIHAGQTATVTAKLGTNVAGGPVSIPASPKVRVFLNKVNPVSGSAGGQVAEPFSSSSIAINDGQYSLTVDDRNHLKAVEVGSGKVLFDGPVQNVPGQPLPEKVEQLLRQILQKAEAMSTQPPVVGVANGLVTISTTQPAQEITAGGLFLSPAGGGTVTLITPQSSSRNLVWANGTHALVLTMADDKPTHLLVMGAGGKTIFDGPVETAEQQAGIPAEVRDGFDFLVQHPEAGHEIGK
ncbi:MAG: PDZ domain-containing protein [Tepidisphaeraceae bacterium]